ncbi:MAG: transcription antitermination factor NusB [Actinomycetes bacterium]|jgi:transcription antitermination factor NusB|nr:transcription antitermination factor NusB [Actinomycetes bacterium]
MAVTVQTDKKRLGNRVGAHSRSYARLYAVRLLYAAEMCEVPVVEMAHDAQQCMDQDRLDECLYECSNTQRKKCAQFNFFDSFKDGPNEYARQIVAGVAGELARIDGAIADASRHWAVFRMPVVDRAILRVAVWELLFNDEVPDSVAINEAVMIAKDYGGDDSSKFINGVLGKIAGGATHTDA